MAGRIATQCEQCGQVDDHPKVNMADTNGNTKTVHHDCLSVREREALVGSAGGDRAAEIVEACEGGLRGDELLAFIQEDKAAV